MRRTILVIILVYCVVVVTAAMVLNWPLLWTLHSKGVEGTAVIQSRGDAGFRIQFLSKNGTTIVDPIDCLGPTCKVGNTVQITYDPENPTICYVGNAHGIFGIYSLLIFLILPCAGGGLVVVYPFFKGGRMLMVQRVFLQAIPILIAMLFTINAIIFGGQSEIRRVLGCLRRSALDCWCMADCLRARAICESKSEAFLTPGRDPHLHRGHISCQSPVLASVVTMI